ncbi:MAG: redoxin domain-containing protein [Ignavibacteria bacterium]|nr:redoxin domain-containing protein [Ignavibacteria bacterium]
MTIKTGDMIPEFSLNSFSHTDELKKYSISDFKGKKNVLLVFFPMAFTGVCSEQNCTISDSLGDFASKDLEVFGISTDGTFVQKEFAKTKGIKYPLLSDFNREVITKLGLVHDVFAHEQKETAKRAVVLINKEGEITYMEITENPGVQVNFDKLKEAVEALG